MTYEKHIEKTLIMKPEVTKIFDDLDAYRDFCRFELLPFDEADLYNRESPVWNQYYAVSHGKKFRSNESRRRS